jgi:site-specific DNA-methyltransferase (adenine-specific)
MKPYYEDGLATLYCGDSREILREMADRSADVVLTDPPYGVGESYTGYEDNAANLRALIDAVIPECRRVASRVALTPGVTGMWLYPKPNWVLCWAIPAGVGRNPWGFACWQPILVYGKDPYLEHGRGSRPDLFISNERSVKNAHTCPKPLKLWANILVRIQPENSGVVLDPFAGSGTTLIVASQMGRKSIGIEQSQTYCDLIVSRLGHQQISFDMLSRSMLPTMLGLGIADEPSMRP